MLEIQKKNIEIANIFYSNATKFSAKASIRIH